MKNSDSGESLTLKAVGGEYGLEKRLSLTIKIDHVLTLEIDNVLTLESVNID